MRKVVALADSVWEGELVALTVAGRPVLLARTADGFHAYLDRCAHLGVRVSGGRVAGGVLTCPIHGWSYRLASGEGVNPRGVRLSPLPVSVDALGRVVVEVPDDE